MKITKIGHSCILIEDGEARLLLDPGGYTTAQNRLRNLDAILITQEHPDHLDVTSVQELIKGSPGVQIFTNKGSGWVLKKHGIAFDLLEDGQKITIKNLLVEAFGTKHADIYASVPPVDNTGFLIGERFFFPGDAFVKPPKSVDILALPVAGPWMKLSEAIDYAKSVNPRICFPVHDGILKFPGPVYFLPEKVLSEAGIKFLVLEENKEVYL